MKIVVRRLIRGEKGQVMVLVLILLVVGGLVITPLLDFMGTGLKVGEGVYKEKMYEIYAADAGIEDGLWQIRHDGPDDFDGYDEYDYSSNWTYSLNESVNGYSVNVTIANVWMPKDIPAPNADTAQQIIEEGKLIMTGFSSAADSTYEIKMSYAWDCGDDLLLEVNTIGIWLPPGFKYAGNCSLEGEDFYSEPQTVAYKGGYAVVWDFASVRLSSFPGGDPNDNPMVITFTFQYTPEGQSPNNAVSWIDTTGVADVTYTWDADVKIYKILSVAGDCEVEAYTAKGELRKLGSGISGNYFATGSSLIGYAGSDKYRDRLYRDSEATIETDEYGISGIPSDANIEAAFLYWTGWIDCHYREPGGPGGPGGPGSEWVEIPELNYYNYAPDNLTTLIETNAKVNNVSFSIGDNVREVTAAKWQVAPLTGHTSLIGTWSYCCFADVTDLVKEDIQVGEIPPNGAAIYTLSHSSAVINQHRPETSYYYYDFYDTTGGTGYPLGSPALGTPNSESDLRDQSAYAGWSLVVIYSSPETKGHQLYLYDIANPGFLFTNTWIHESGTANPDFDGDGSPGGHISGFLVPEQIPGEDIAAKLTVFVGEGDNFIDEDRLEVNGDAMSNAESPSDNVWNSRSPGLAVPGVDIDTFYVYWDDGIVNQGDTSAQVDLPATSHGSGSDGFNLVYIIISFRSDITSGGSISYLIR